MGRVVGGDHLAQLSTACTACLRDSVSTGNPTHGEPDNRWPTTTTASTTTRPKAPAPAVGGGSVPHRNFATASILELPSKPLRGEIATRQETARRCFSVSRLAALCPVLRLHPLLSWILLTVWFSGPSVHARSSPRIHHRERSLCLAPGRPPSPDAHELATPRGTKRPRRSCPHPCSRSRARSRSCWTARLGCFSGLPAAAAAAAAVFPPSSLWGRGRQLCWARIPSDHGSFRVWRCSDTRPGAHRQHRCQLSQHHPVRRREIERGIRAGTQGKRQWRWQQARQ